MKRPSEISFLHSYFEMTRVGISQGRVEGHSTIASYLQPVSLPGRFIQSSLIAGRLAMAGGQNAHVDQI